MKVHTFPFNPKHQHSLVKFSVDISYSAYLLGKRATKAWIKLTKLRKCTCIRHKTSLLPCAAFCLDSNREVAKNRQNGDTCCMFLICFRKFNIYVSHLRVFLLPDCWKKFIRAPMNRKHLVSRLHPTPKVR